MHRFGLLSVFVATFLTASIYYARTRGLGSVPTHAEITTQQAQLKIVLGTRPTVRYDAGQVERGGRLQVSFVVSNPGPTAVTVGSIRTSCDCLRIELDATRVEAGTDVRGRAVIDLAAEPQFVGGLMLDAKSGEADGLVLAVQLSVNVK
jgi:hypothetical protein